MHELRLNRKDYINYGLFINTDNKKYKRDLIKSTLIVGFIVFALSFKNVDNTQENYYISTFILDIIIMVIVFFILRRFNKKRVLNHINESYKSLNEIIINLEFKSSTINTFFKDENSECKSEIKYNKIEQVSETKDYYFISYNTLNVIIIPKKHNEIEIIESKLLEKVKEYNLKFVSKPNWVWK